MLKKFIMPILVFTIMANANAQNANFKWNKNQVIAHRGAWKANSLPENSIAALQKAFNLGCHGSEFDVQITADSIVVVNHDDTFFGKNISKSTYAELLAHKKLSNGEDLPTLDDYLNAGIKQQKTKLILEIKPQKTKEMEALITNKVIDRVKALNASAWIEYISFSYSICKQLIAQGEKVYYLNGEIEPKMLKNEGFYGFDYNLAVVNKNTTWIKEANDMNLATNVWTVNAEKDMLKLLAEQVNYITTNEPELLLKLISK